MGQTLGKVGKPGDQVQVLREHATSKGVQGSNNPHHNLNNNLNNVIFHIYVRALPTCLRVPDYAKRNN